MAKITPRKKKDDRETVVVKTRAGGSKAKPGAWWNTSSKKELCETLLATAQFLKQQNQARYRQLALYMRLYGNLPMFGYAGSNLMRISTKNSLPSDRPTMSVITSCTDTIVSRMTQARPRPVFLTDNGDYRQRNLAKEMNQFIAGEFYQTKAYQLGELALRDACVGGDGLIKVLEIDKRVALERRLSTQLLVDPNEAFLGDPRQKLELSLIDRSVAMEMFPGNEAMFDRAEQAYPEQDDATQTISDQIIMVEAWRLPSGKDAGDGLHAIACSAGLVDDEEWKKKTFPFVKLPYSPAQVGYWGQGLAERQMGNQNSINKLLMTIHKSINLVGVPRVFVEDGSKVVKAQINNDIGAIVTYRGTKPQYEVAPCVPAELYAELQNVINRAYQEEGVSQLASTSRKPAGLNSGEALREYDDIQSDRFASLQKRYANFYEELASQVIDKACDIAERDGKYQTVFPDKDGTREINLPDIKKLRDNPFAIQCFDSSSLPRDPSGRLQKVTEMMQAGIISPQEGRRLLDYPDIAQEDKLANAGEERILKILDQIVEDGKYTPPDPFMDLAMAEQKVVQYYNLYSAAKLEEDKAQKLRTWFAQVGALKTAALPPPTPGLGAPGAPSLQPQANPMPAPQSELIPNVPGAA